MARELPEGVIAKVSASWNPSGCFLTTGRRKNGSWRTSGRTVRAVPDADRIASFPERGMRRCPTGAV